MVDYTPHYCADTDMTFVTKDLYNERGDALSTAVIGFYFGEPNEDNTFKLMIESINDPKSTLIATYEG